MKTVRSYNQDRKEGKFLNTALFPYPSIALASFSEEYNYLGLKKYICSCLISEHATRFYRNYLPFLQFKLFMLIVFYMVPATERSGFVFKGSELKPPTCKTILQKDYVVTLSLSK